MVTPEGHHRMVPGYIVAHMKAIIRNTMRSLGIQAVRTEEDVRQILQDMNLGTPITCRQRATITWSNRWGWTWLQQPDDAWRKRYPKITAKIDELEARLKKLEK